MRNIIVGVDIGTTKICTVVGEISENGMEIRAVGISSSKGLRKGVVVDIDSTVEAIREAVMEAETLAGIEIDSVYVGITGGHVKGFNSYGAVGIRGREVTHTDVDRVIDSAKAVYVPLDREVLHVIPTGYILDGQEGIRDPAGMVGVRLEANVHIITGAVTSIQNLLKCCERAGLDVVDIVFEPIASAEAILTEDERELGVVIVDIGGGTTDIALYRDGWLQHVSVLAVGGNHFTNDIAVGLRIPVSEAERIKRSFGAAIPSMVDESEEIAIIQAGHDRKVQRRCLSEIIQPRTEELLGLIKTELISSSGYDIASSGIVLTGGGSLLSGLVRLAEAIVGLPVRIGFPENVRGCEGTVNSPIYATGVGLVLYSLNRGTNRPYYHDTFSGISGILGKMRGWVKEVLDKRR